MKYFYAAYINNNKIGTTIFIFVTKCWSRYHLYCVVVVVVVRCVVRLRHFIFFGQFLIFLYLLPTFFFCFFIQHFFGLVSPQTFQHTTLYIMAANSLAVWKLVEKLNNIDSDIRFMSLKDLEVALADPDVINSLKSEGPEKLVEKILLRLADNISEVQNEAVKW